LDPDAAALRELLRSVGDRLIAYAAALPDSPGMDRADLQAAADLGREPFAEHGRELDDVLTDLFDRLIPAGVNPASPGSLSYVNGGGLVHAAVADLITAVTNRYGGFWAAAPGLNALEWRVVRWICDLIGFPESAGGLLLTGGSMANLTAIATARDARLRGPIERATLYASDQMHHSIQKAARVCGLPADHVRAVPTDARQRLRGDRLEEFVASDRERGLMPFCLVGTAGSTNSGAVDDLPALADVAARHGLWFHVDAAYGGFFALTARGRRVLAGIDRADSATIDPHKGLFLPFGTGALVVRNVAALRCAHGLQASCVASIADEGERLGGVNFADLSIEQTRPTRGLRVWLPLTLLGVAAFRDALDERLDLAAVAESGVRAIEGLEVLAPAALASFACRVAGEALPDAPLMTRRLADLITSRGDIHLATAEIDGRPVIRISVLSFRTGRRHVDLLIDQLRWGMAQLAAGGAPSSTEMQA
jgi:aromatic-L-amino-acid decarboxylase